MSAVYRFLLSKNVRIKIYKTVILSSVLYWNDIWSHPEGRTDIEGV